MASQAETALKGIRTQLGRVTRRAKTAGRELEGAGRRENLQVDFDRALRTSLDRSFLGSGSRGSLL